ncbi:importin beta-like SAD2 isoform X2 [Lotus japonicus]|uniref:importin beta-like SAD2 isoform X2 n=1 Tax=Lotus japonicus TaxID=34305 RepID=UPI0025911B89|nr:importin beta-like SAD2 isoform X2 [Lotus japonicus]
MLKQSRCFLLLHHRGKESSAACHHHICFGAMDLQSLAGILHAALSPNPHERKEALHSLDQLQYAPQHLVRLMQIIVDNNCDMGVRHVASIHFKNFIVKNWSPIYGSDVQHRMLQSDEDMVRDNILIFITQVPPLLRIQLGECLKTIINSDYPVKWPHPLEWVKHNLRCEEEVYCALFVLQILSKRFMLISTKKGAPGYHIVEETFPHLRYIFNRLVQIVNPSLEAADLIKFICKIFWYSIHVDIPQHLFDQDIFDVWMVSFLNLLERPVPSEGQPVDPELRKSWGWWKVKKWIANILNRLFTRFGQFEMVFSQRTVFTMFHKHYAGKILECHLNLLNVVRFGDYLPDRVINLILQYLTISISRRSLYALIQPRLDVLLFEIIFPLICFNDNDQKLWDEDPQEYARKGYDIFEDMHSPSTAAMDFVSELVRKRGKENLQKCIQFIVETFKRYDEASIEYKPYRQKDGALRVFGTLHDKFKEIEPYKSELEHMLVHHVFPELNSPVGHLRAKAAWVAGQYAHISFSYQNNFQRALQCIVLRLQDSELPVRVDSFVALRSFIEACKDMNEIFPILPRLLDEFSKLMNEVENEALVFTLETMLDKFGEDFTLALYYNLAGVFWRRMNTIKDDDEASRNRATGSGCLRAISIILESVSCLPDLFVQIEPTFVLIMRRMLTNNDQESFKKVLEILSHVTCFSRTISPDMWSLWPLMMEALTDWATNFFPNALVPINHYISKGTAHFLTCKEPDYQQSLGNVILSVMSDKNMEDNNIVTALKLIEVVLQNCRGQVDHWVSPFISITVERLRQTDKSYLECHFIQMIADALYYNATLTISILKKLGVVSEIFHLWFDLLSQVQKNGSRANFRKKHERKVCCLGLTSLLTVPADQLQELALGDMLCATLDALHVYKDQINGTLRDKKYYEDEDGGDGLYASDDEMYYGFPNDGYQANAITLGKCFARATKPFNPHGGGDSGDEYSDDDEELQSPVQEVNPLVFFVDTLKAMQSLDPSGFKNLHQTLDPVYQHIARNIARSAEEIENEKLEKAIINMSLQE